MCWERPKGWLVLHLQTPRRARKSSAEPSWGQNTPLCPGHLERHVSDEWRGPITLVRMRETSPAHWQQHSWGPWPFLGLWSVHQNASSVSRRPLWFGYITGISLCPTPRKWVSSNHQRALSPSYVRFGQIYKKEKKRASRISVKQKS